MLQSPTAQLSGVAVDASKP
jgi:hypothetical protein